MFSDCNNVTVSDHSLCKLIHQQYIAVSNKSNSKQMKIDQDIQRDCINDILVQTFSDWKDVNHQKNSIAIINSILHHYMKTLKHNVIMCMHHMCVILPQGWMKHHYLSVVQALYLCNCHSHAHLIWRLQFQKLLTNCISIYQLLTLVSTAYLNWE